MIGWLLEAAVGPAAVALPVNWAADELAGTARRWFKRLRRADGLSRLVGAAAGTSANLTSAEFDAVRKLLEDQQTWTRLGRDTVDDLAGWVARSLPAREGRSSEESGAAALAIVRGLLEFAVADLEPKLFQQVLLARLQRMETGQANALDMAMFDLHARYASVMDQLELVVDRLPTGPARQGEIVAYLWALIDWLNTDPWPQDPQFDGPVLTPAAIERKLRVTTTTATGPVRGGDLDADRLVGQCRRLVILGGAGSGKTWLAKRTARRCAEDALQALAAGKTLDEIELPIYTTCSGLFNASGDIREAVVSSALNQLSDLGGSRIRAALHAFFVERNAPTVLVMDSLDEAHGPRERLRQADTLPWRIVLTTRPSSWRNQIAINRADESHRVGELQPLHYPGDVEPFIQCWFAGNPEQSRDLIAQIARRPGLQQAATVPLILSFYCIVAGSGPLPEFRRDLYARVLNRLLTGRWRADDGRQPDPHACLSMLRAWAWSGASSDPVSGVGTWDDDIPTDPIRLGATDIDALDHIATPVSLPDLDTGTTLRRFIHRSIREHLVAEHVASLPAVQAATVLLPHLWYDSDWENVAPTALAAHPERDQLARDLIHRAAGSGSIPKDISVIDAGWQFRKLLSRVAAESSEADWSPDLAAIIGQARVDLSQSAHISQLDRAASWGDSNRRAREALLGSMTSETRYGDAKSIVGRVVLHAPTAEDKCHAREALLSLLGREDYDQSTGALAAGVVQLDPTAEDKRQAREILLGQLADGRIDSDRLDTVARLDPTAEDYRQAREVLLGQLASTTSPFQAEALAFAVFKLDPTPEDKNQARDAVLAWLDKRTLFPWRRREYDIKVSEVAEGLVDGVVQLAVIADDKRRTCKALLGLMASETHGWPTKQLVGGVVHLATTAEDKRQAHEGLVALLSRNPDAGAAKELTEGIVQLAVTLAGKRRARNVLLTWLARETKGWVASWLAEYVLQLDPTEADKRQARENLLAILAGETSAHVAHLLVECLVQFDPALEDKRLARQALLALLPLQTAYWDAAWLADGVVQLDPAPEDKHQACQALLGWVAQINDGYAAAGLAKHVAGLDPSAADKRQAREDLLRLLARKTSSHAAKEMADSVVKLDPTAADRRQAREDLLRLLVIDASEGLADCVVLLAATAEERCQASAASLELLASEVSTSAIKSLVEVVVQLAATAEEKRQARQTLLSMLARETRAFTASQLTGGIAQLDPTAEERHQARHTLLSMLARETHARASNHLAGGVIQLAATTEERHQARHTLLSMLARETAHWAVRDLLDWLIQLDPTVEGKRQAREILVRLLSHENVATDQVMQRFPRLDPTAHELGSLRKWGYRPSAGLLVVVRRNSALTDWLGVLRTLNSLSDQPATHYL